MRDGNGMSDGEGMLSGELYNHHKSIVLVCMKVWPLLQVIVDFMHG